MWRESRAVGKMSIWISLVLLCSFAGQAIGNDVALQRRGGQFAGLSERDGDLPLHLKAIKNAIEKGFTIDWSKPPYRDSYERSGWPCFLRLWQCARAYYYVRDEIVPYDAKISAWYTVNVEGRDTASTNPVEMRISQSTSHLRSATDGWSISASGTVNPLGKVGGVVTHERSRSTVRADTDTTEYSRTYVCPPFHHCQIQTLAWHMTITNRCHKTPIINCGGAKRACRRRHVWCQEFRDFADSWCDYDHVRNDTCTIESPILEADGRPMFEVRMVETPLRPRISGWTADCTVAILDDGELWDPSTNLFLSASTQRWYQRPGRLLPKTTECADLFSDGVPEGEAQDDSPDTDA